jgi:hypothetical protein
MNHIHTKHQGVTMLKTIALAGIFMMASVFTLPVATAVGTKNGGTTIEAPKAPVPHGVTPCGPAGCR